MLFEDVQRKDSATQIPFTGTPFIILGKKKLGCTHGVDGCISSATVSHAGATKAIEAIRMYSRLS